MSLVISRTPFRISFFGGGTDYPGWYRRYGGAVLSAAINKYCYISCRRLPPFFGIRHRIVWSHIETVNSIAEILHPAVRVGLPAYGFTDADGIELHHQGDLPARTGIGSSSAFAVGLINVLTALRGTRLDRHALALAAIDLEQNRLKDQVGSQDQIASAYGGLNRIAFATDGAIKVEPMELPTARREALERSLLMFYTGMSRLSSEIARNLVNNLEARRSHLERMRRMVDEARGILCHGELDDFGRLLHETWRLKRELADGVSSSAVDEVYETGIKAGALGGKLLGAGGAGFMAFYVPEARREAVVQALRHLVLVPVRFDFAGSTLIHQESD